MADRTVTEAAFDYAGTAGRHRPELGVIVGFCRGALPWRTARISPTLTVGRDPAADLTVDDAGVSRIHVQLEHRGAGVWVSDQGSRNGTFVNGERVPEAGALAPLGSVLRVGKTLLVVSADVSPYAARRVPEFPQLIGGAALDDARVVIDTVAATKTPILILGDTGTGKEVVAGLLHQRSGRAGQFVALNCAAVPHELVDAELFGHSRGAFSGAVGARAGLFRTADQGSLFLDEIGELPASVQAKLLRVLETEEVRAVGEDKVVQVDVRIIAATNRDVDSMVESGDFRGDLVHRLAGLRIVLPALRERIEDLPALSLHFLADTGLGITATALERLMLHAWPGNVRELRNVVRAASEVARRHDRAEVEPVDVSAVMGSTTARLASPGDESELAARVTKVLSVTLGSVPEAAQQLGMSRSVLYETLRRLRIDPKAFRSK